MGKLSDLLAREPVKPYIFLSPCLPVPSPAILRHTDTALNVLPSYNAVISWLPSHSPNDRIVNSPRQRNCYPQSLQLKTVTPAWYALLPRISPVVQGLFLADK